MPRPYAVTLGETMALFRSSEVGSVRQTRHFELSIGGAESNVAIALSRLGIEAHWIGRVGHDELGARIVRDLTAEGVRLHVTVDDEAESGLMIKERVTSEHTRVTYRRRGSAGSRLRPSDIESECITEAALLHVSGISLAISESARESVAHACALARAASVPVSFDVNHRSSLWNEADARGHYSRCAEGADIIFAGIDEAAVLLGREVSADDAVRALADLGPSEVILKLGERGCLALVDGVIHRLDAVPIVALDSVGAGDAFVAGYLAERLEGGCAERRLTTAVRAGALACLAPGDWEGSPTRETLRLLDSVDPVIR
ncbi:sugar kinase [Agreia sp. COWG]|uniref:sugar kinase n=1 Tax=Agreia sp. COWG TaxID=2773266 RepID=UPI0019273A09|nr:sugar kinase [Agreia sp. COWG]CAD6010674.1 2-dehydro-3-deoxygluconokinase [Agreia sp. COWG]